MHCYARRGAEAKAIPYEVDWASLADDAEGLNFSGNLSCHRLNMALRGICQDAMGKQAVAEGLKLIKPRNVKEKSEMKMSLDAGVLEMCRAYALRAEGCSATTRSANCWSPSCRNAGGLPETSGVRGGG